MFGQFVVGGCIALTFIILFSGVGIADCFVKNEALIEAGLVHRHPIDFPLTLSLSHPLTRSPAHPLTRSSSRSSFAHMPSTFAHAHGYACTRTRIKPLER